MSTRESLSLTGSDLINSTNVLVSGLSDLLKAQALNLTHIITNVDKNVLYSREELLETNERITSMLTSIACLEDTISQKLSIGEDLIRSFNPEFHR